MHLGAVYWYHFSPKDHLFGEMGNSIYGKEMYKISGEHFVRLGSSKGLNNMGLILKRLRREFK